MQKVAHADGGNQPRQTGGASQGLVGKPLNDDAQKGTHRHGGKNAQNGGHPQVIGNAVANVRAHHDNITVGKVQHFGNTVDHGIAQRDDGINGANADSVYAVLQDVHMRFLPSTVYNRGRHAAFLISCCFLPKKGE